MTSERIDQTKKSERIQDQLTDFITFDYKIFSQSSKLFGKLDHLYIGPFEHEVMVEKNK